MYTCACVCVYVYVGAAAVVVVVLPAGNTLLARSEVSSAVCVVVVLLLVYTVERCMGLSPCADA